jgi:methylthioribose-1-phosphate isomerase
MTNDSHRTLEAIKYFPGSLLIIDQLALPHETRYIAVLQITAMATLIK